MRAFRITGHRTKWIVMAVLTFIIAAVLSPWASPHPDGLERVAEDHGFLSQGAAWNKLAVLPDYELPGVQWAAVSVGLAGFIGICVMAVVLWGLTRFITRSGGGRNGQSASDGDGRKHNS